MYRLDFEEFEFDGGSDVDKPCDRDFVEIFSGEVIIITYLIFIVLGNLN